MAVRGKLGRMQKSEISLIVNADDLGAGPGRDRGIFESFEKGIVTSASLLANGPTFTQAAATARALGLPTGVHLNLSEGRALAGPIHGITDSHGNFPGKYGLRYALLANRVDEKGIFRELSAQVERVAAAGLAPDHLDTHQHFFLFPAAAWTVVDVARACQLLTVRLPLPREPADILPSGDLGKEIIMYRRMAPFAAGVVNISRLVAPEGLWGMPYLDRLDEAMLADILKLLPPGTWELMVHPGYEDSGSTFSGPQREMELSALTAPAIGDLLRRRNIRLIRFGDLPCAS
jgi:chitin disaccharide deacetylase